MIEKQQHQEDLKEAKEAKAHPAKAAHVHPLAAEATALLGEIVDAAKQHREHVAKLRTKLDEFNEKTAGERLSPQDEAALEGIMTEVESALNKLDPDSPITV